MALSRSSHNRWQAWAIRTIAALLIVYTIGTFTGPTRVPYVIVMVAVVIDGLRCVITSVVGRPRKYSTTDRGETIH